MAVAYNSYPIVTNGLVLALDAANPKSYPGTGATWTDLSGNSNNATLFNTPAYSSVNSGTLTFNGTNTYGTIPGASISVNQLTVSMWFKNTGTLGGSRPISKDTFPSTRNWAIQLQNATRGISWICWNASGTIYSVGKSNTFNNNVWYNLVCTYSSVDNLMKVYINDVLIGSQLITGNLRNDTSQPVELGRYVLGGGSAELFSGQIGHISIYNRALSATEVTQNYDALKVRYGL